MMPTLAPWTPLQLIVQKLLRMRQPPRLQPPCSGPRLGYPQVPALGMSTFSLSSCCKHARALLVLINTVAMPMHADALELCRQQGPQALQLLACHAMDHGAVRRAWSAACSVADDDPQAATEAWLVFLHAFQWGLTLSFVQLLVLLWA